MGCGSCGVASSGSGKTAGCQSNGGCSSGGCNRLNVFDWLADIPASDFGKPFPIVEVGFNQGSRKEFYTNHKNLDLYNGAMVTVEGVNGFDIGYVSLTGELVKLQLKKYGVKEEDVTKKILRLSSESELQTLEENKNKEKNILIRARAIARSLNLDMKIGEAEIQADGKKVCIYYTANSRVDFRELIKIYAQEFNARIEMRQIGARQESGKVGGIGSCGRELCCSTWLTDFKTVYTSAARYQNLSINQTKLSGQCGKLKCCLNYELDTYMDALTAIPKHCDTLMMKSGKVTMVKKDVFKQIIWYSFEGNSKHYPLSIERVNEIIAANKQNIFPEELEPIEIVHSKQQNVLVDAGFVNDVGQISLQSLIGNKKKKKSNNHKGPKPNKPNGTENRRNEPTKEAKRKERPNGPAPQRSDRPKVKSAAPKHAHEQKPSKELQANNNKEGIHKTAPKKHHKKPNNAQQSRPVNKPPKPKD